eukprot:5403571-Pyramimonas_sp.AAC.1
MQQPNAPDASGLSSLRALYLLRPSYVRKPTAPLKMTLTKRIVWQPSSSIKPSSDPVSYTHLTLPTILLV